MKHGELELVIKEIIRRLDGLHTDPDSGRAAGDPLQQLEAFMPVDPVLARLHKEYLDANRHHKTLAEKHGLADPMTEVAADMLDSARSALQTRLIELQEMREAEVEEAIIRRLRARRAEDEAALARAAMEKRAKDRDGDGAFWFMLLYYWLMRQTFVATGKRLSAANDFALANTRERRASYA